MNESIKTNKKIIILIILGIIFSACIYLFYNQAIGNFNSDLIMHIKFAIDGDYQYSITGIIYKLLYKNIGELGISIFLALVILASIYITKIVLNHYIKDKNNSLLWIYAILLNFIIAIYIPILFNNWVVGVQEPNEWHNSTYICMKPLGLLVILLYFNIEKDYLETINKWKYLLFTLLLILVNSVKPNFITVFAPTMLVFLIIDFFKNLKNKKAIKNIIIFGCAVLISLPILFYQQSILFGSNSGSSIKFGMATVLKLYNNRPILSLLQSAAFPLFILLTNIKTVFKERKYLFTLILNIIALAQYLFLEETGHRAAAGNFAWGYSFSLMMAFICALSITLNLKAKNQKSQSYFITSYILLGLHTLSGIIYFIRLILGYNYF